MSKFLSPWTPGSSVGIKQLDFDGFYFKICKVLDTQIPVNFNSIRHWPPSLFLTVRNHNFCATLGWRLNYKESVVLALVKLSPCRCQIQIWAQISSVITLLVDRDVTLTCMYYSCLSYEILGFFLKEKVTHTEGIGINTQDCQTERFLNQLLFQVMQVLLFKLFRCNFLA